jgi:uncharacterized protein (UPF0248 family)
LFQSDPHKSEKIETITRDHQTSYENFVCRINEEFINMFNNNETEVHIPLHRALRVRRGGRGAGWYQYYKLHDCLHHGDELKKDWMEMIIHCSSPTQPVKAAFISTNFTTPLYILINTFYLSKYIVPVWSKSFPSNLSLTHHHDEDQTHKTYNFYNTT